MSVYYHVPMFLEEVRQLQFVEDKDAPGYFHDILLSQRPRHIAPSILFERDRSYPGELFGVVYDETGHVVHFLYLSSEELVLPFLTDYRIRKVDNSRLSSFQAFKKENSRPKLSMFLDRLLQQTTTPRLPPSSTTARVDPVLGVVLFLILSLLLHRFFHRKQKETKEDEEVWDDATRQVLGAVQDPEKKELLRQWTQNPRKRKSLLQSLRDPHVRQTVVSLLLETHTKDLRPRLDGFLKTLRAPTRKIVGQVISQVEQQLVSHAGQQKQQTPPSFSIPQLYQFLQKNNQQMVSPSGSVSPVFQTRLRQFLEHHHAPDPSLLLKKLVREARQHRALPPADIKKKVLHYITEPGFLAKTTTPQQKVVFALQDASPSTPPLQQRLQPQQTQPKQPKQQKQTKTTQTKQTQQLATLVWRNPKPNQTAEAYAIMDDNLRSIRKKSERFREIATTLCQVIRTRGVQTVYMVDAPNVLNSLTKNYTHRQQVSKSPLFARVLWEHLGNPQSLMVIVSQMNRSDWVRGDPVYFSRIGRDQDNTFLVRVGCVGKDGKTDCHAMKGVVGFNECDDFVLFDTMARITWQLRQNDWPVPTFVHVSDDKGENWHMDIEIPVRKEPVSNTIRTAVRSALQRQKQQN